jgi:hypothetical protein
MKVDAEAKAPGWFIRAVKTYEEVTGQSAVAWVMVALLNLATQAVLFHQMVAVDPAATDKATGEFGTFNAALGIIGLLTVPVLTLQKAMRLFFARAQSTSLDRLRGSTVTITETFAWVWGACCVVLILLPLPLPSLPRFALELFTLMNVLLTLGAAISFIVCAEARQLRRWTLLVIGAGVARLVLSAWFTAYQPWAEAALGAFLVAGFVTLAPALRPREITTAERLRACASALDGSFLRFAAATLSVLIGIYLFTNADRIAALSWMNIRIGDANLPSAQLQHIFDIYQATGLLARGLLWATLPLLWLLYAVRSKIDKTTPASLKFFWIYLGTLVAGAGALGLLAVKGGPIDMLIPGAGSIGPTFAAVMIPLGLLQGLGIFSLASRRYPECFVIGGCGIVYALVLAIVGRRPETMLPYMFGLSVVALMILLFVGVVRWGRKQP